MFRVSTIGIALAALVACEDGEVACTDIAVASVNLTVADEGGAPIAGATATYSVDGADPIACDELGNGSFACGFEQAGVITVVASAPGYADASDTVTVGEDECHVIGESLALTLAAECLDDTAKPSIEVTVVGSSGETLENVEVAYAPSGGDDPSACTARGGDLWSCGIEERGDFVVTAVAGGHGLESADVTVEADECHVITEQVRFELDWLPD